MNFLHNLSNIFAMKAELDPSVTATKLTCQKSTLHLSSAPLTLHKRLVANFEPKIFTQVSIVEIQVDFNKHDIHGSAAGKLAPDNSPS
jgi:hypothetical protein